MTLQGSAADAPLPERNSVTYCVPPVIPDHEVLRRVGQGAYGDVWLGRNVVGTFRAVKVVYRHTFPDDRPFEREFAGIRNFEPLSRSHPGVVAVLHIGRNLPGGYFYYVMELADDVTKGRGFDPEDYKPKTLRQVLGEKGRLPARECLQIGLTLMGAIGHLHSHGLIHRDIKPSNVIFVGGQPKLADIGLVTSISEAATSVGTEGYMPPEGAGTPMADLFSLGRLLYEISTGLDRSQFPSLPSRLYEFPDAPALARLNEIIVKACDPHPRKRFRDAAEMEAALHSIPGGSETTASRAGRLSVDEKSVAVLPFVNMSPDSENEYLSDGVTEDITMALAQVKGLRVTGRTSAFAFKGKARDVRKIAEQLGVRNIVEGSIRKSGNRLRITTQLVNAIDGCCLWSDRYDREMKDVLALQDEISRSIAEALQVHLIGNEPGLASRHPAASPEAYKLYLQGRYCWNMRGASLRKALHYFELALLEQPDYALAYTGIADSWSLLAFYTYVSPAEAFPRAEEAARKAVELAPNLAEAHNSLGFSKLMFDWDRKTATTEFLRALEINPSYSPARYWLASYLSAAGMHGEAIAEDLKALQGDPMSALVRAHLGWTYLRARDYPKALEGLQSALELDPNFILAHWGIGRAKEAMGDSQAALNSYQELLRVPPFDNWGIAWIGYTRAVMGQPAAAREALLRLEEIRKTSYVRPFWFALLYLGLGESDAVFEWLRSCIDDRDVWVGWIRCDPAFDSLHADPRFLQIRRSTGLE